MRRSTYRGDDKPTHYLPVDAASVMGIVCVVGSILTAKSLAREAMLISVTTLKKMESCVENPERESWLLPCETGISSGWRLGPLACLPCPTSNTFSRSWESTLPGSGCLGCLDLVEQTTDVKNIYCCWGYPKNIKSMTSDTLNIGFQSLLSFPI